MEAIAEARQKIEAALADLDSERARLEGALKHLGGANGSSPRKQTRKQSAPKARKRQAKKGQRRGEVLTAIIERPGIKASEIAKKLNVNPSQVHAITAALVKEKMITKKGPEFIPAAPKSEAKKAEDAPKAKSATKEAPKAKEPVAA